MATIEHALPGVSPHPREFAGIWSWVTTVDHKRIGVLYMATAVLFFLMGGIEALIMRSQLARPNNDLVTPDTFNQLFTMHGTTMIFLAIMPMGVAFFNLVVPLMIGARDVAFPRLNAFSYWVFLFGGLLLNSSFIFGGAPNGGWFAYAPNTELFANPGHGMDFWAVGLLVLGVSSVAGALNFVVTIINLRAPGLSFMRLPVFVWMTLVVSFLLISAMPIITVALILLIFDRNFGTNFFVAQSAGDPLMWQHLFWLFGHPEVYILILPAMGIVSEVLPTFSRKPLFGYPFVVFAGVAIGFMGWGVWAHHMFTTGLGAAADSIFAVTTMLIALPTGVKVFNWIATTWGGSLRFTTAMQFSLGFIALFTIGGLQGVSHAVPPSDMQQQDTYYIVSHIHYVLFTGAIFGLMSGIFYWYPKMTGRLMNETSGKIQFWLMFIGANLAFGSMGIVGMDGMPRRIYTYPDGMGWDFWNLISTIGAFTIGVSILLFLHNFTTSLRRGAVAGNDPWDGRTLEWAIPSPPPPYNFAVIPVVHARDPWWYTKYGAHGEGAPRPAQPAVEEEVDPHSIHMPDPSYYPAIAAFGFALSAAGLIFGLGWTAIGLLITLLGIYGWAIEPASEQQAVGSATH